MTKRRACFRMDGLDNPKDRKELRTRIKDTIEQFDQEVVERDTEESE